MSDIGQKCGLDIHWLELLYHDYFLVKLFALDRLEAFHLDDGVDVDSVLETQHKILRREFVKVENVRPVCLLDLTADLLQFL